MIRVGNKSACSVAKLNSSIGNPWVQELIPVKMKRIPFHWSLRFLLSAQARVQAPKCDHGEDDPKLQPMPSPAACIHLELMKTYWNYWNKREGTWDKATQQETNEYKWDKTWQDNSTKKKRKDCEKTVLTEILDVHHVLKGCNHTIHAMDKSCSMLRACPNHAASLKTATDLVCNSHHNIALQLLAKAES